MGGNCATRFTMHLNRTTAAAIPTYFDSFNWCDSETFEVQQRWQQVKVGPSAAGAFVVPDLCKTSDCYEGKSDIRPKGHELQNLKLAYNTKSDSV